MLMPDYNKEPEKYSSYKGRMFSRYKEKFRLLMNGIDDTSLKSKDKVKLKQDLMTSFLEKEVFNKNK